MTAVVFDEGLAERMRAALKGTAVKEKQMFGGLAFLANNGKMFSGIVKDELMLRLSTEDFEKALKVKGVRVMDFTGKPMKNYVFATQKAVASESTLKNWMDKSQAFALSLK